MPAFKTPDFNERTAAAREAKQRALDKLRAKPAPDPAAVAERLAAAEARDAAAAERREAKRQAAEDDRATRAAAATAAAAQKAAAEAAAKAEAEAKAEAARPKLTPEEQKAARDARYAARKARKR